MPGPTNTLLIEGPFDELAEELAVYIDGIKKDEGTQSLAGEVVQLLQQNKKDEALKKIVTTSAVLNAAPEKEFVAAYNLLIHLLRQSPNLNMFLPKVCGNLSQPITSSPNNGPSMALTVLTTIFNIMAADNDTRYHIFLAILSVVKTNGLYDTLRPQLKHIDRWISEWDSDDEEQRKLFLQISDVAQENGQDEEAYGYLIRALGTIPPNESSTSTANNLAIRALKTALSHPSHFAFQDLTPLDSVQALRKSDPPAYELLEIFSAKLLEDYEEFMSEHSSFLEQYTLDNDVLTRKIRLLTLASLAANTPSRALAYSSIAEALRVPEDDVEMWVIDVIRAGLVEGKLSQLNKTFLIHRSTYRVFGEKQWREVDARLETWKESLRGVLQVIKAGKAQVDGDRERETREHEGRRGGYGGDMRGGRREIDLGLD